MTAGTTMFCPPECNPTYGHVEHCERFEMAKKARDPRVKMREKFTDTMERMEAEARGEYVPPQQPQQANGFPGGTFRHVADPQQQQQAARPAPVPVIAAPPQRPMLDLARAGFVAYCSGGCVPNAEVAREIARASAQLLATVTELEQTGLPGADRTIHPLDEAPAS